MTQNNTGAPLSPEFLDLIKALQNAMPTKVATKLIEGYESNSLDMSKMYFISQNPDLKFLNFVKFGKPIFEEDGTPNLRSVGNGKLVKVLRSLLSKQIEDKTLVDADFETFHNIYTSVFSTEDGVIEVWEGEAIYTAYNEKNYYTGITDESLICHSCDYSEENCTCDEDDQDLQPSEEIDRGSLWESCMRYQTCQYNRYFDIYVDHCKILVLNCDGKVRARALIWQSEEGITFVDRIYATEDRLIQKMIAFIRMNKWDYKTDQNYSNKTGFQHYDVEKQIYRNTTYTHRVKAKDGSKFFDGYNYMPYMDTMTYLYPDHDSKSVYFINNYRKLNDKPYQELTSTSGDWNRSSFKYYPGRRGDAMYIFDPSRFKTEEELEVVATVDTEYGQPEPPIAVVVEDTPQEENAATRWENITRERLQASRFYDWLYDRPDTSTVQSLQSEIQALEEMPTRLSRPSVIEHQASTFGNDYLESYITMVRALQRRRAPEVTSDQTAALQAPSTDWSITSTGMSADASAAMASAYASQFGSEAQPVGNPAGEIVSEGGVFSDSNGTYIWDIETGTEETVSLRQLMYSDVQGNVTSNIYDIGDNTYEVEMVPTASAEEIAAEIASANQILPMTVGNTEVVYDDPEDQPW